MFVIDHPSKDGSSSANKTLPFQFRDKCANLLKNLVTLLASISFLICFNPLNAESSPDRLKEITQLMEALAKEIQQNQTNINRTQQIMQEVNKLNKEYQRLLQKEKGNILPDQKEIEKAREKAKAALKGHEDDPCYFVQFEKELTRRLDGSEMPWLACVPTTIHIIWQADDRYRAWNGIVGRISWIKYTLEESYRGFLRLQYDKKGGKFLDNALLKGPAPNKAKNVRAKLTKVNAFFHCLKGDYFEKVTSNDIRDFKVYIGSQIDPNVGISADKKNDAQGGVESSNVIVGKKFINCATGKLLEVSDGGTLVSSALFTLEEFSKGVSEGRLSKEFQFNEFTRYPFGSTFRRKGKVNVRVSFEKPGVLTVSPTEGYKATGPDKKGNVKPKAKTYNLKNTGGLPIEYSVSKSKNWVDLSNTKGELAPKATSSISVSLNEKAKKLEGSGPHTDTVKFINTTNYKGNTTRFVKLTNEEHWRVVINGWNTLYFGGQILAGGIKVFWRIVIDFTIKDGKYEKGKGTARFNKVKSHSNPPGVYGCGTLKGTYLDKNLKRHNTPYIKHRNFNVPGKKLGSSAKLFPTEGNLYVIGYDCVMDTDHAKLALKNIGAIKAEDRIRQSRKFANDKDVRSLPSGTMRVPLKDGHIIKRGRTKFMDDHEIRVYRIK